MTYFHLLCSMSIGPPILRYHYFKNWPWKSLLKDIRVVKRQGRIWLWKFNVKVMAKVKHNGHISGLEVSRYVCFSFRDNRTTLGWGIANSIFDLEIQGQGHSQCRSWWSHFRPRVQSICVLFVSWQSDHFWLRYSWFHIWPWTFKVKVATKIDQNLKSGNL